MSAYWSLALAVCLSANPAFATDVKVHVTGIDGRGGDIRVQVCTRETFLKLCPYRGKAPARRGAMDLLVPGVPPGVYAVIAHHDINRNGKVDTTLLGIPEEGVGFSRSPMLILRAPTFDETALQIGGPLVEVPITLKFEP